MLWRAREVSRRTQNSLTSDLPGLHLDGRSINGERPFLVGSAIICRVTDAADRQSMQLTREPNVDPMFCAKPTDGHFSYVITMSSRLGASEPRTAGRKAGHFSVTSEALRNGDVLRSAGTPRSKRGRKLPLSSLPYREGRTRLDNRVRATPDNSLSKTALYGGQNNMLDAGRP